MLRGERGQGLVEYGLILFFIVLAGAIGLSAYSNGLGGYLVSTVNRLAVAL